MSSPSSQTILVTGASGFIGAHIIHQLLEKGYNVRGCMRSESSGNKLRSNFSKYSSQISIAVVPDIMVVESYKNAFEGDDAPVTGIMHLASPFVLEVKDNVNDLLEPAIKGAVGILKAADKYGEGKVRHVVSTGSFSCIVDTSKGKRPGYTYTEADWNPMTYDEAAVEPNGAFSYSASKRLAETAQWEWMEKNKPSFSLSVICPPWVFGPHLPRLTSTEHLNTSTGLLWKMFGAKDIPDFDFGGFCDVRNVAEAHVSAFEKKEAGGERFLVGAHFDYQTAADYVNELVPGAKGKIPVGEPGHNTIDEVYAVDGSKAEKILGIKYISLKDCMKDSFQELVDASA
jgi:NADPH-dependent methylglyoxal reductase